MLVDCQNIHTIFFIILRKKSSKKSNRFVITNFIISAFVFCIKNLKAEYKFGFFRNPLAQMEEEKREHDSKMKKMEAEMEQVFEMKVKEKKQKLKDSELELTRRHEERKKVRKTGKNCELFQF